MAKSSLTDPGHPWYYLRRACPVPFLVQMTPSIEEKMNLEENIRQLKVRALPETMSVVAGEGRADDSEGNCRLTMLDGGKCPAPRSQPSNRQES